MKIGATALPSEQISGRPAIPVIRRIVSEITDDDRRRLNEFAETLLRDDPSINRTDGFGPRVVAGLNKGPAVLIGDQREIGLHESLREQMLEHRIALLAASGDTLVVEREFPVHEEYLRELLDLRELRVIAIGLPSGRVTAIAARCRDIDLVRRQLVETARAAGQLLIIPHIGCGSAWKLAGAVARQAYVPVGVAAPPPRLTRCVNDKIWFAARVREVLGERALPPTFAAYGPAAVAGKIAHVARKSEKVIVKTPDSAGSMGNVAVDADIIRALPLAEIRRLVLSLLRGRGWRGRYPLLVGVWESDALASPSIQLWIPARNEGDPVVEGVFEQRVAGPGAQFVGAVPAHLAPPIIKRMADEASHLAYLFQALGYFGRCSFDCLIIKRLGGSVDLHWIECNGRWGGVSVPMTLANRLFRSSVQLGLVIVQDKGIEVVTESVTGAYKRLGELLFRRGDARGIIPLSAGAFTRQTGMHFMAVAESQREAEDLSRQAVARLSSLN